MAADDTKTEERELKGMYPELDPYDTGFLKVDERYNVYYEQAGNPDGKPVIFIHGGPGGGINSSYRRFHDPDVYRIVLFDQRGCGKTTPHACLEDNTTWHLVEDIEKIRKHLGIEKWQVFGGSWGSTLSLAYAETHPERCMELVLRGIFMLRAEELEFFYQKGASFVYPDAWEAYRDHIPEEERGDMMEAYRKRLTSDDKEVRLKAAIAWSVWEGSCSRLLPNKSYADHYADGEFALAFARIENHYFKNGGFLEHPNQLLDNAKKIRHIPGYIAQGRYDMVCPMKTAWDLHRVWPEAELEIMPTAGHSCMEPAIMDGLIRATDRFGKRTAGDVGADGRAEA